LGDLSRRMRCVALRVLGAVEDHGSGHVGVAWLVRPCLAPVILD
jgi:hypothetical protein